MSYKIDWDKIRREVDIEQYFLYKYGNTYHFDKYKRAYVLNENGENGDIIRFFHHEKNGIKMYYSITYNDCGDIIQFIKKRIINNKNASISDINNELSSFLGLGESSFKQDKYVASKQVDKYNENKSFEILGEITPITERQQGYLVNYRKLSVETVLSKSFKEVLFNYKTQNISTLGHYIKDTEGKIVGIGRTQTQENEYFNKKWFEKNSKNGIGFTFSNEESNTETLSIFESI